ncbi:MAG: hypothetical protein R6W96_02335 [Clostridia bacterium]
MKKKMIIFNVTPINTDYTDMAKFEENVKRAAGLGATHIHVTEIEKSTWIWDRDRKDPYPNWGMLNTSLFKVIVPDELKEFLPGDYAKKNLELIKKKTRICRKYGLQGAGQFCEPFYLPEEVYRVHPEWRGPRCDHPRRARNVYYSPCMDHPEILAMYRKAMKEFCSHVDLDYLFVHTNDSGSGICWSSGLYNGPNGPEWCRHIPVSQRILSYFKVFRQGAKEAGRHLYIETNSNIGVKENEHAMDAVWPLLEDGMAVNFKNNRNQPLSSMADVLYEYNFAPVRNIPLVWRFLELLEKGWHEPSEIYRIGTMDDDFDLYFRIIEKFMKKPTKGLFDRVKLLREVAVETVGRKGGDQLVLAWEQVEIGLRHFLDTYTEGFSWCSVNQRLINRPFVLFPQELTPGEKSYYRDYQFQANTEEHADDLLDNQNTAFIRGHYAIFIASRNIRRAMDCMDTARRACLEASGGEVAPGTRDKLLLGADRFELLNCFFQNYIHAMKFQDIIDNTDYEEKPEISARWPIEAEDRMKQYDSITRAEIDNTYRIIGLIDGREREMLVLAPDREQEDIFWLSPDITEQLKKKAGIMLDHQLDGKRLFVSHNK